MAVALAVSLGCLALLAAGLAVAALAASRAEARWRAADAARPDLLEALAAVRMADRPGEPPTHPIPAPSAALYGPETAAPAVPIPPPLAARLAGRAARAGPPSYRRPPGGLR